MQGASLFSLAYKLLLLIFLLTVDSTEMVRLSGAVDGWQTDRRYPSKLAITEGGGMSSVAALEHREADCLIHAIKAFTAPVSMNAATQRSDAGLESLSTANIIATSAWLSSDRCVLTGRLVYRLKLD